MFKALARGLTRRPLLALLVWLLLLAVASVGTFTGFGGKNLFQRLHSDTSTVPGTESSEVYHLTQIGDDKGPSITMIVSGLALKDEAQAATVAALATKERAALDALPHTATVVDPFSFPPQDPRGRAFLSDKGDGFVVVTTLDAQLDAATDKAAQQAVLAEIDRFGDEIARDVPGATVKPLSTRVIGDAILAQTERDLVRGEAVGLPIALVLMVLVFGGAIAAGLPLVGALTAIVLGMFGLWLLTHAMTMDSFILNVISLIGLALSIDYGLLVVSRFREEAHARLEALELPGDGSRLPERSIQRTLTLEAVDATIGTAGRTVAFSALTIAFAVVGLLVMRSPVLRSIGIGAVLVVLLAVLTSTTLVPALLALVGHRLLAPSPLTRVPGLRWLFGRLGDASTEEGAFSALARWVHRHPWGVMLGVLAVLVVMCLPFGTLMLRNNFSEYIPAKSEAKAAYTTVQQDYPALATPEVVLVVDKAPTEVGDVVAHVTGMDGVSYVSAPQPLSGDEHRTVLNVAMDVDDPVGPQVTQAVQDLRAWGHDRGVLVGGAAAGQYDFNQSLLERAPLAIAIMAVAVLLLMFLMTGSVLVPLKALLINILSLVASLGATWFVFEHGLFGLPRLHGMETFVVAVALSFGFGLAMDYEVFLLARIKEYWDAGVGNDAAVEHGLQRSGRIITSAAAIIIAVFVGFVAGDMVAIKQIGVALAIVVITDASLVRMLLVPSTMTLLGQWNWWAPRWLKAIHARFGIIH